MDDANLDLAVDGAVWAVSHPGQRCTRRQADRRSQIRVQRITSRLVARAKKAKSRQRLDPGIDMGPCVTSATKP